MSFPELYVEVGFSGPGTGVYWHIGDSARGKIGTAAIGPDELWTDVTDYVREVRINRGANRVESPAIRYEAGRLMVELDNSDRRFDPTNLSGPYVVGGVTQVTPMRAVRVRAVHDGTSYDLWRGYADAWEIRYNGPRMSICTLTATDGVKVLSAYNRTAVTPVGSGEDAGARISRILDSAGWPATDRVISTGDTTVQATTLEGNAWAEALLVQDTEMGELYIDGAGRVVFRNRQALLEESRSSTSQATFADDGTGLPYQEAVPVYDDEALANLVRVTRVGGVEQVRQDAISQSDYLVQVYERTDLVMESDAEADQWAGYILTVMKDPEFRIHTLVVRPRNTTAADEDALFTQVLGREIGDRITVVLTPPGGGSAIEQDVYVRGISHEVRPLQWQTTWTLQSAGTFSFWTIGDPVLGQIGTVNAIAF